MKSSAACSSFFLALALFIAGCGGGGDSAGSTGTTQNRAAIQTAVKGSAQGLRLIEKYEAIVLPIAVSGGSANIQYDGNLYYSSHSAGNVTTISYFTDPAGTLPAGNIVLTVQNGSGFPKTVNAVVNVTGGSHPTSGSLNFSVQDALFKSFTLTGHLVVQDVNQGTTTIDFSLVSVNGSATGSVTVVTGGETISLTNIQASHSILNHNTIFHANLSIEPQNISVAATVVVNDDGSGHLAFSDGTTATWNTAGAGTITFSNGITVAIGNLDNGS